MSTPEKNKVVHGKWASNDRIFRAKWSGRRWLRFNDLFGGWDPVDAPSEWKPIGGFNV